MRAKLLILFALILVFTLPISSHAENISISASVGDTVLILEGFTIPNSLVTFTENQTIIGNTVSDSTGAFSKEFNGLNSGPKTVQIHAQDPDGLNTLEIEFNLALIQFQTLTLSDIYLPPTIMLNSNSLRRNQELTVSGYSLPNSLLNLDLNGPQGVTELITANNDGEYQFVVNLSQLASGDYDVSVTIQAPDAINSTNSQTLTLTIVPDPTIAPTNVVTNVEATSIPLTNLPATLTPAPPSCPYEFAKLCLFDQQKEGFLKVDQLTRYLLGFVDHFFKPKSSVWDINNDGVTDSTDLSIVLYHANINPQQILGLSLPSSSPAKVLGAFTPDQTPPIVYNEPKLPLLIVGMGVLVFGALLYLFYTLTHHEQAR